MVRRVRQDVLDQLPPRTDVRVPVELTEPQREEHDALTQPIASLVQRSKTRPLTQAEFLRLMSLLTTQRIISNGLAQLRFEEVWPAIRSCAARGERDRRASRRRSSWSSASSSARSCSSRAARSSSSASGGGCSPWRTGRSATCSPSDGLRAGFFTGAEGQKRRTQNIVEFHDDPAFRILFASDAGGVGLNLQHAANCVINLELPWNPAVLEQRIGRIYRLGQTQPIDVYNLVSEEGIESRIAGLVGSKQAFFKGLFDGESDSVQFDQSGSFLSRVEALYEGVTRPGRLGRRRPRARPDADADLDLDDEVNDPFEPLIEAADESDDAPPPPCPRFERDRRRRADRVRAVGRHRRPRRPATSAASSRRLQIRRETDGRVVIEAPAEAASDLGALFEGMAALMRSVASPAEGPGPR